MTGAVDEPGVGEEPGGVEDQGGAVDVDVVVIGAGQAGLSSAYFCRKAGFVPEAGYVILDRDPSAGGAWQHRWPSLRLGDVHGIHDLPGLPLGTTDVTRPVSEVMAAYFARYERSLGLPVHRPVRVDAVRRGTGDRLLVETGAGTTGIAGTAGSPVRWAARAVINATGTWDRPFWPSYPGRAEFAGRQLHTADYRGPEEFRGQHVVVVGGGTSAIGLLVELSRVATTTWVTRHPPRFRPGPFTPEEGRAAVALVAERVREGRPPDSVVSSTGLPMTPAVREAQARGVLHRLPMFDRISRDGVVWDGAEAGVPAAAGEPGEIRADAILWCTGFRPAVDHLAPLGLRTRRGGLRVEETQALDEPRLQLVGYGPSASTIGANRAGRIAVRNVRRLLGGP